MTNLESFLSGTVEEYMLGDLRAMNEKRLGYPVLITIFAGVELLGALLSLDVFDRNNGRKYFKDYWCKHLYPDQDEKVAEAIYQLYRHGIAHAYVLKGSLVVDTVHYGRHLKRDMNGTIYIHSRQLTEDFQTSFERLKSQRTFLGNAQTRLDEISNTYLNQFNNRTNDFESLPIVADDAPPLYGDGNAQSEGASGPNGLY